MEESNPGESESEALLILVIWRDLRISSRGTLELLELGVLEAGCSGTMFRQSMLELRLRCLLCIVPAQDKRHRLAISIFCPRVKKAADTLCVQRLGAVRAGLKRSLRPTAVVTPDGSWKILVAFATRGVLREAAYDLAGVLCEYAVYIRDMEEDVSNEGSNAILTVVIVGVVVKA